MRVVNDWLRGKKKFDEQSFVDLIGNTLSVQLACVGVAPGDNISDLATPKGAKALGYIYGFVDAALRCAGIDMADEKTSAPILYRVLYYVFKESAQEYFEFIIDRMKAGDPNYMAGCMYGGQQYLDWVNGKLAAPMGLGRCVVEVESNA